MWWGRNEREVDGEREDGSEVHSPDIVRREEVASTRTETANVGYFLAMLTSD
jgi:hypothetical protein